MKYKQLMFEWKACTSLNKHKDVLPKFPVALNAFSLDP